MAGPAEREHLQWLAVVNVMIFGGLLGANKTKLSSKRGKQARFYGRLNSNACLNLLRVFLFVSLASSQCIFPVLDVPPMSIRSNPLPVTGAINALLFNDGGWIRSPICARALVITLPIGKMIGALPGSDTRQISLAISAVVFGLILPICNMTRMNTGLAPRLQAARGTTRTAKIFSCCRLGFPAIWTAFCGRDMLRSHQKLILSVAMPGDVSASPWHFYAVITGVFYHISP